LWDVIEDDIIKLDGKNILSESVKDLIKWEELKESPEKLYK